MVIKYDRGTAGTVDRHWPPCWPASRPAATNGDSWTRCGSNLSLGMIGQALTALHAIAGPLCLHPGTQTTPPTIFIPGGARHARWESVPSPAGQHGCDIYPTAVMALISSLRRFGNRKCTASVATT